jgi:hypothetical protein
MEIHVIEVGHNPLITIHKCVPKPKKEYNTSYWGVPTFRFLCAANLQLCKHPVRFYLLNKVLLAASTSEYPFALIAAGIITLAADFTLQDKKKWAAFLAPPSTLTLYLFLHFQRHDEETESR